MLVNTDHTVYLQIHRHALRVERRGAVSGRAPPISMTTLVVVRKNNEVAIAADSLTTFGDTRMSAEFDSTYDKIVHHKGTYIGFFGRAAPQLVFANPLSKHEEFDFFSKRALFET